MKILEVEMSKTEKNSFFDSEEFKIFMCDRIEKVLLNSKEYAELQNKCCEIYKAYDIASYADIEDKIETKAQELCYMQGWKDAVKMLMGSLS